MKKTLLFTAIVSLSSSVLANDFDNGRLSGMAGAGFATGSYTDGVLKNPSLGASFDIEDDFSIVVNGGGIAFEENSFVENLGDLVDFIDEDLRQATYEDLDIELANQAKSHLNSVEGGSVNGQVGANIIVSLPNRYISAAFVAKAHGSASVYAEVSDSDYGLLDMNIDSPFYVEDLQSNISATGVLTSEIGVALSRSMELYDGYDLLVGVTPKKVTVESFVYDATIDSFDENDFNGSEYTAKSSSYNADAGITLLQGPLRYGLSVTNIYSRDYETIGEEFVTIEPRTTASFGYKEHWLTAELAVDVAKSEDPIVDGKTQYLRAGMEINGWNWFKIRAGYRMDLANTQEDTYSLGLGISPFNVVNLDVAAFTGEEEAIGGALQLGVRF